MEPEFLEPTPARLRALAWAFTWRYVLFLLAGGILIVLASLWLKLPELNLIFFAIYIWLPQIVFSETLLCRKIRDARLRIIPDGFYSEQDTLPQLPLHHMFFTTYLTFQLFYIRGCPSSAWNDYEDLGWLRSSGFAIYYSRSTSGICLFLFCFSPCAAEGF